MMNPSMPPPVSYLREEAERLKILFSIQPAIAQHFLELQARQLADGLLAQAPQLKFTLPDQVIGKIPGSGERAAMLLPPEAREQAVGGWLNRFRQHDLRAEFRQILSNLEQSPDQAVSTGAILLRYALVTEMVYNLLPAGRTVTYRAEAGDEIPSIPVKRVGDSESALTETGDALVQENPAEDGRGQFHVPFVPAARQFYLPQWVAFDAQGQLLVNSLGQAEANQVSMERYVLILHTASSLAPYMLADEAYQRKRYGILGQVVNQGRALACYQTRQIIQDILQRVTAGTLNRGLRISLPYYDDQKLRMAEIVLEAIPAGRIAFKAIFVVRAVRLKQATVSQDTRLSESTRRHLLHELHLIEQAFLNLPLKHH